MAKAETRFGPWENGGKLSIIFQRDASGGEWWAVYSGKTLVALAKEPANARLIAASPDLYAFVVEFLEWHEGPGRTDSPLAEDARRLLSRVEQPQ